MGTTSTSPASMRARASTASLATTARPAARPVPTPVAPLRDRDMARGFARVALVAGGAAAKVAGHGVDVTRWRRRRLLHPGDKVVALDEAVAVDVGFEESPPMHTQAVLPVGHRPDRLHRVGRRATERVKHWGSV